MLSSYIRAGNADGGDDDEIARRLQKEAEDIDASAASVKSVRSENNDDDDDEVVIVDPDDIFSRFAPSTTAKALVESPLHSVQIASFTSTAVSTLMQADVDTLLAAADSFYGRRLIDVDRGNNGVEEKIESWDEEEEPPPPPPRVFLLQHQLTPAALLPPATTAAAVPPRPPAAAPATKVAKTTAAQVLLTPSPAHATTTTVNDFATRLAQLIRDSPGPEATETLARLLRGTLKTDGSAASGGV